MSYTNVESGVSAQATIEPPSIPSRHLHFFGPRRSGNHAVLGWIQANAEANGFATEHFNDIHDKLMSPPKVPHYDDPQFAVAPDTGLTIYSYQDIGYEEAEEVPFYAEDPEEKIKLTVIRDLPNLIASRIKMYEDLDRRGLSHRSVRQIPYEAVTQMWVGYAKAYVDEPDPSAGNINFPLWFQSSAYRSSVFASLNLGENTDSGLNNVADFGFGSSFDLQRFDGRAQEMKVLERWREYEGDARFDSAVASHPDARGLMNEFQALTSKHLAQQFAGN